MRYLLAAVTLTLSAVAAPVPKGIKAKSHVGEWKIEFKNGVVEQCSLAADGKAAVTDQVRTAGGKAERGAGGVVVVTFDDDRTERWTPDGDKYAVEHWFPSAAFPTAAPVRGTAARTPAGGR